MTKNSLSHLPAVQTLLREPALASSTLPRWARLEACRLVLDHHREQIQGHPQTPPPDLQLLIQEILTRATHLSTPTLRRVINATGIVLHTNLGRAPLGERAIHRVVEVARAYSTLEYDLESGNRGSRQAHTTSLIRRLTGAEAALVVNNNAAAIFLTLSTLTPGKEVIVSRGELVEIGGSFRVPDILAASGAHLREVGTTNRTHLSDYQRAITPQTGALLKVHTSNFRITGFTRSTSTAELATLAHEHGLPLIEDLGSGSLKTLNLPGGVEHSVASVLAAGADLVTLSGDKLLGGPQAGIIAGKAVWVSRLKAHPLARVLRIDKLTLAALEGTLLSWLEEVEDQDVPVMNALARSPEVLRREAEALKADILAASPGVSNSLQIEVREAASQAGGGSLPDVPLPTWVVALHPRQGNVTRWEKQLRMWHIPVITRIQEDAVILDPRTLLPGDSTVIVDALAGFCRDGAQPGFSAHKSGR